MPIPTSQPLDVRVAFGAWLRERRKAIGLSQEEAAKEAGIVRQQWLRIEAGESGTRRETIPGIARAVRTNVDETYERAGYSSGPQAAPDVEMSRLFDGLNEEQSRLLISVAKATRAALVGAAA